MKEILAQLHKIWEQSKPLQKGIALFALISLSIVGVSLLKRGAQEHIEVVVSGDEEPQSEPHSALKGFELFDTNTWIKGDKELQVLEMRALKGQLEKDLAGFDQIKSASVILDLTQGKAFGGAPKQKPRASVILTLAPKAKLSVSQLRAITFHLAGAVHGLEPNMIAISDTTGKLYKAIDPEGEGELISNAALAFEEHLTQKIEAILTPFIKREYYTVSVQVSMNKGDVNPSNLSIALLIDKGYEGAIEQIERQLKVIALGVGIPFNLAIDAIPFNNKVETWVDLDKSTGYGGLLLTLLIVFVALLSAFLLFRRYRGAQKEDPLFKVMTRIDIGKLAESVKGEDPATIALMLSYLEASRAEEFIASFPETLQEEVLHQLSELEYENY